jgi:hypothetical protein
MKIDYKKTLKFITLVIMALLIATVSAATYSYMYIDGGVVIGTEKIVWIVGADAPAGTDITGSTATVNLDVEPGYPKNFTECLLLKNQDTSDHNMTINVTTALLTSDFDWCYMDIYENSTGSWVFVDTLNLTDAALDSYETYTGNVPLGAGKYYRMKFAVAADSGASGTKNFDIQVRYE